MSYVYTAPQGQLAGYPGYLGYLGDTCLKPAGTVSKVGTAVAKKAVSSIPVVGPILGLIAGLFGQSAHSKCAHDSADRLTYLQCRGTTTSSQPPPNQSVQWNDPAATKSAGRKFTNSDKCGWYDWCICPGAVNGVPPAGGCGTCCQSDPAYASLKNNICCADAPVGCGVSALSAKSVQGFLTTSYAGVPAWGWMVGVLLFLFVLLFR